MNILITGGTGFIGDELRTILLKNGHNLIIITRDPKKYESESAKNQQFISWDDDLVGAMEEAEGVINLAGENLFGQRWTEETKKRIMNSRVQATKKLVDAMEKAVQKPKVFVSASASGIYGDQGDEVLTEDAKTGDDYLAKVCTSWENESQKASDLGVRVANPRIGIVLEKEGGALKKMLPPLRFFVGGPIGNGEQYMSWIHRTDLCNSLIFALEQKEISGPYNVCSPYPVTMNEFAQKLGEILNRPSFFRVPEFVLSIVLGEASKPVLDSIRMQPKKLLEQDFTFQFEELEEALADII